MTEFVLVSTRSAVALVFLATFAVWHVMPAVHPDLDDEVLKASVFLGLPFALHYVSPPSAVALYGVALLAVFVVPHLGKRAVRWLRDRQGVA